MAGKRNWFYSFNQKIATSRPGVMVYKRTLHLFDALVSKLTGDRHTMTSLFAGAPTAWVTTTGAKSGMQRTTPLIIVHDPQDAKRFALIGTNFGRKRYPGWYYNLKTTPRATCKIKNQTADYKAHMASGEEYEKFWQAAGDVYLGYPKYKNRIGSQREIPIIVLTPEG